MSEPESNRRGTRRLPRIWAVVTAVALLALAGAAISTSWPPQIVLPVAVIIAAGLYLLLGVATPLGRM